MFKSFYIYESAKGEIIVWQGYAKLTDMTASSFGPYTAHIEMMVNEECMEGRDNKEAVDKLLKFLNTEIPPPAPPEPRKPLWDIL